MRYIRAVALMIWFCIGVLIIILLYKNKQLESVTLNRIGIALNFAAGFMLAPELLGTERLVRAEMFVENGLSFIYSQAERVRGTLASAPMSTLKYVTLSIKKRNINNSPLLFGIISLILGIYVLTILPAYLAISIYIINTIIAGYVFFSKRFFYRDEYIIIGYVLTSPFATLAFALYLIFELILFIISLIGKLTNYLLSHLAGDNQLRSILVGWGIVFFIVGNLLQFIGTY